MQVRPLLQLQPGAIFARDFRVEGPLAAGGMGAVYVVEQLSTGKKRALKIIHPELALDAKNRERFSQEARVGARIDSEHVVEVVAAGVDEASETPWLAMELLQGESLATVIKTRGRLPVHGVLEVFRQLCHALGAAHQTGVVHRDLKPDNIFLARSRRQGVTFTVKVLDFGIARLVQEQKISASTQGMMGSPLWMAPEQVDSKGVTPATDVWALGLLAFYMLCGVRYWKTGNVQESQMFGLLNEIGVHDLDSASVRAGLYGMPRAIPPGFDAWFSRCLNRVPTQRFPNAAAALDALVPILEVQPFHSFDTVLTEPDTPNSEAPVVGSIPTEPMRPTPPWWHFVVALCVVTVITLVVLMWLKPARSASVPVVPSAPSATASLRVREPAPAPTPPTSRAHAEAVATAQPEAPRIVTPSSPPPTANDTVAACEAQQDHACVVRLLSDRPLTELEMVSLVRAFRGLGRDADCRREMRRYLQQFPTGSHVAVYQQRLAEVPAQVPLLPERATVAEAFRRVAPRVAPCGVGGTLNASVLFGHDGVVRGVTVLPPHTHTPTEQCAVRAILRMRLPAFGRPTFTVVYPFALGMDV